MSRRGVWAGTATFSGGQRSDLPPHLIPEDSLAEADNVILSKTGRLSKRGPVQPYLKTACQANIEQVGISKIQIGSGSVAQGWGVSALDKYGYGFVLPNSAGVNGSLLPRTGSLTSQISLTMDAGSTFGPAFNSFGLVGFPLTGPAGATATRPFYFFTSTINVATPSISTTGVCILTANRQTITIPVGAGTSARVGQFIYISNYAGSGVTANEYIGIITEKTSNTIFNVYPPPTNTFTTTATGIVQIFTATSIVPDAAVPTGNASLVESGGGIVPSSASFGCVHQNRVVLCTLAENGIPASGSVIDASKTRQNAISWSSITGESGTAANTKADGLLYLLQSGWPKGQRLTLDTAKVVGLVSMDANNLMVLCIDKVLMISGTLGTVVSAAGVNTSSFTVRTIAPDVGCIDADSIQRTPYGVMFASRNGVYITDGASFTNVMVDKVQGEWNTYQYDKTNAVCGSAVLNDTHYVLFTQNGPHFACDLTNNFAWTKITTMPDIDGNVDINYDYATQTLYTRGSATYTLGARCYDGTTPGSIVTGVALGGDIWRQTVPDPSVGGPNALSQITGVTTDTTTATRDIGVSQNASRIVVPTTVTGVTSLRVYTISGSVATLEQNLTVPPSRLFNTNMRLDMNEAGNTIVVATDNGFAVYERSGTTWSNTATFALYSGNTTPVISGDGTTIAVSSNIGTFGAVVNVYKKVSGTWTLSATLTGNASTSYSCRPGNRNLSVARDGTWIVANAVGPTNSYLYTWYFESSAWSSTKTHDVGLLTVLQTDGVCVSTTGYIVYNTIYAAAGVTQGLSFNNLMRYSKTNSKFEQLRAYAYTLATDKNAYTGYATWGNGGTLSFFGAVAFVWTSDNVNLIFCKQRDNAAATINSSSVNFDTVNFPRSAYQSYGVGVRDWSGSGEVYAPRSGAEISTYRSDNIVLLDSILSTDSAITTTAADFNQLVDAGTSGAFNAKVATRAYTFGEPSTLKAYKTMTTTYLADATTDLSTPVKTYYAEGLEPTISYVTPYSSFSATPSGDTAPGRMSLIPRVIDNGVSFAFQTDYESEDFDANNEKLGRFSLYELALNFIMLRKGRLIQ